MEDAKQNLGVEEFVRLPQYLLDIWGDIPPDLGSHDVMLRLHPIRGWLQANVKNHDVLLVQGEPVSVYYIVYWMAAKDVKSYAATTKRVVEETTLPDGSTIKKSIFRHVRFRKYIT
jgi:hypothetical protein